MPRRKRTHLTNVLEYVAYTAAEVALGMMSAETAFALGELIGRIAYRLPHSYLQIVRRNLRLAYRNELSPEEIEDLVERVYERNGANIASTIRISRLTDEKIAKLTEVVNKDLIQEAASADRGIVFVIPHMGNWELLAQAKELFTNIDPPIHRGSHYRPLNNPLMDRKIQDLRRRNGTRLFSKLTSLHSFIAFLRERGSIGILSDQRVKKRGVTCDFFGLPTDCSPTPALLAKRSGAMLIALHCETAGPARWRLVLDRVPGDDAAACIRAIERSYRASPEDVFWFQDRWKYQIRKGVVTDPDA
jgi:KDO2-lipid IV(A) lauroyltransferase